MDHTLNVEVMSLPITANFHDLYWYLAEKSIPNPHAFAKSPAFLLIIFAEPPMEN